MLKKEDYEAIFKYMTKLLDSSLPVIQVGEITEKLQLDIALKCFQV